MSGLFNITKYAAGPRNIDAMVDAASNGVDPNTVQQKDAQGTAADQPKPEAQHPAQPVHKPSFMEKVRHILGENEGGGTGMEGGTQLAANDLGIQAVREGLGQDAAHLSDDHIRSSLGSEIVAQIGEKGFPHQEVESIQQGFSEHGLDKLEALQTFVAATNSQPGESLQLMDEKGASTSLNSDQVLQVAGLSRSEIDQARTQEPDHGHAAEAAGAEMSMA